MSYLLGNEKGKATMKPFFAILTLVLVCSACEPVTTNAPTVDDLTDLQGKTTATYEPSNYAIYGMPAAFYEQTTKEQRIDAGRAAAGAGIETMGYLRLNVPIAEKHRKAYALLKAHTGLEWYSLQEMISTTMVELLLRETEPNVEALGFYTRLLVQNENPNADFIAKALILLEGHWTPEDIAISARASTQAAVKWLNKTCPDCASKATYTSDQMQARAQLGHQAKFTAISEALNDLNRIANP